MQCITFVRSIHICLVFIALVQVKHIRKLSQRQNVHDNYTQKESTKLRSLSHTCGTNDPDDE
jgi:hypothetical protein